jgi:catalase
MSASASSVSAVDSVSKDLLAALDRLFGLHPGFRPVHAKGAICSGVFTPSPEAARLTRAPHANRPSTPVHVRYSDFAGVPQVADNDPNGGGPRGFAIRFNLAPHVHTDLVCHSADGFATRTGEEFLELLTALASSGPTTPKPTPLDQYLGSHPKALQFLTLPKPFPTSFARESFFAVSAFKFVNQQGEARHGRFSFVPLEGGEYLSAEQAAKKTASYLFDELRDRLATQPVQIKMQVQLAESGDELNDATVRWPATRQMIEFGTVSLNKLEDHNEPELRKIIFDPRPGVDGLEATADPLFEVRAALYLLSGRRRRSAVS